MASPHVAGGVALLKEQHPDWTVEQVKSALVQTADPVHTANGREVSVLREGGGLVNLPRALDPRLFASPTGITFPVNGGTRSVELTDAGGGADTWAVSVVVQGTGAGAKIEAPASVTVPGDLSVTATVLPSARTGAVTGFVVLTQGPDVRRIPFLVVINKPLLGSVPHKRLNGPGIFDGTTAGRLDHDRELSLSDRRRLDLSRAGGRVPAHDRAARRELRRRRPVRKGRAARGLRR